MHHHWVAFIALPEGQGHGIQPLLALRMSKWWRNPAIMVRGTCCNGTGGAFLVWSLQHCIYWCWVYTVGRCSITAAITYFSHSTCKWTHLFRDFCQIQEGTTISIVECVWKHTRIIYCKHPRCFVLTMWLTSWQAHHFIFITNKA